MHNPLSTGRCFGLSLLAVYALQIGSNFGLQPAIRHPGPLGLLQGAAAQPELLGGIALLGLLSGVIGLAGNALLAGWLKGQRGFVLALLLLGMGGAGLAASLAEHAMQLALRELGQFLAGPPASTDALALQKLLAALRNGLHLPRMLLGGASVLLFFVLAWRVGLLPRALAGLGLLAAASQMLGVSAGVLGGEVPMALLAPLALVHLASSLWLLARGFGPAPAPQTP